MIFLFNRFYWPGVLCSFLVFNLGLINGKKIFLGDSGSMLVGLFITNMLIEISQAPASNSGVTIPATLCLWLTAVPVTDMLVTFVARILKRQITLCPRPHPFAPQTERYWIVEMVCAADYFGGQRHYILGRRGNLPIVWRSRQLTGLCDIFYQLHAVCCGAWQSTD